MKYEHITPFVVAGFIGGLGIYDLLVFLQNGNTVSYYVWTASGQSPGLPVLLGVVMGHFFFDKNKFTSIVKYFLNIFIATLVLQSVSAYALQVNSLVLWLYGLSKLHLWFPFLFGVLVGHCYWNRSIYCDENGVWKS